MNSTTADHSSGITRRSVFTNAGLGVVALAAMTGHADAADPTAAEKANIQVVNNFCAVWPSRDVDKIMSFFADNCAYRVTETQDPYKGREAVTGRVKQIVNNVQSFDVIETFSRGPMVINERKDNFTGLPLKMWHGVGVFFLKDGKIVEWYDYTISIDRA